MSFLRKALWVGTGGLSGVAGIKANSKKERTAKALEKQNRVLARQETAPPPTGSVPPVSIADELAKLAELHDHGALTDEEFNAAKRHLLESQVAVEIPAAKEPRTGLGVALKSGWAEGAGPEGIRGAIKRGAAEGKAKRLVKAERSAAMRAGGPAALGYVLTLKGRKRRQEVAKGQSEKNGAAESN